MKYTLTGYIISNVKEEITWKKKKNVVVITRQKNVQTKNIKILLSRIEGQVRGIKKMVENDTYCTDILVQVSAVNAALNSFNKVLLANHIRTCVAEDIREGKDETIDELVKVLQKLMK